MARQTRNRSGSGKRSTRRRRQRSRKQRGGANITPEDNSLLLKFIKLYLANIPEEYITLNKPVEEVLKMLCSHKGSHCDKIELYPLDEVRMKSFGEKSILGMPHELLWQYTEEPREGYLQTLVLIIKLTVAHLEKNKTTRIVKENDKPVFIDGYPLLTSPEKGEHIAEGGPVVKYALHVLLDTKGS